MTKFTRFVAVLVTATLLASGAEAGNYRRIFLAYGEVTGYVVNNLFGLNATCYDIPLYDFPTNLLVGTAKDCLSDVMVDANCTMGMSLTAATNFSIGADSFVNRAIVAVKPLLLNVGSDYTHITGSFVPGPGNGILETKGIFMDATGGVRLSGAVNLARGAESVIKFNCIFVVNLTLPNSNTEYSYEFSGAVSPKVHVFSALVMILLLLFGSL